MEHLGILQRQESLAKQTKTLVNIEVKYDFFKSKIYIEFLCKNNPTYAFDLKNLNEKLPSKNYRVIQGIIKVIEISKQLFQEPVLLNIFHQIKWLSNDVTNINAYAFEFANCQNVVLNFNYQKS